MSKKEEAAPAQVSVQMTCVYAGHPNEPGPGDIVSVDAEEAERLIGLGAAKAIPPEAPVGAPVAQA